MPVLTAVDLLGIQRFVFASRRLRDVIGASLLVAKVCSREAITRRAAAQQGEVLLAAGGNALLRFEDIDLARRFAAEFTRELHDDAPGLEASIAHRRYRSGELARAIAALQVDLVRTKTECLPTAPMLGLSVTETCQETGHPAERVVSFGGREVPVSRATQRARTAWSEARQSSRWMAALPNLSKLARCPLQPPRELDDLGRSREDTSLLAVVHLDGNRIGARITQWLGAQSSRQDEEVWGRFGALSEDLDALATTAMTRVMERVARSIQEVEGEEFALRGTFPDLSFTLRRAQADAAQGDEAGQCLPVWPVLVGGDDVTFVCDGRIALDLTVTALNAFEETTVRELGRVTGSAGVAIVRSHAPFARAYELSEALCRSAKTRWAQGDGSGCALDWHLGEVRPGESVAALRRRQYKDQKLTARPMLLGDVATRSSWRWLDAELLSRDGSHSLRGEVWTERRNKVKALREALREGEQSVERTLAAWRRVDGRLGLPPHTTLGTRTPVLDAIELMDVHLPLLPREVGTP